MFPRWPTIHRFHEGGDGGDSGGNGRKAGRKEPSVDEWLKFCVYFPWFAPAVLGGLALQAYIEAYTARS